jgi:hypothetical protein
MTRIGYAKRRVLHYGIVVVAVAVGRNDLVGFRVVVGYHGINGSVVREGAGLLLHRKSKPRLLPGSWPFELKPHASHHGGGTLTRGYFPSFPPPHPPLGAVAYGKRVRGSALDAYPETREPAPHDFLIV